MKMEFWKMREKTKKIIMSLMVFTVVVLTLVGTVWSVYADTVIGGGALKNKLGEAAKVQAIANTLSRCISDIRYYGHGNKTEFLGDDVRKGDIFGRTGIELDIPITDNDIYINLIGDISTGPWLAEAVSGKGGDNDGTIWCVENSGQIIKLFATYVLGSSSAYVNGIVCDSKGEAGGIFTPYSEDGESQFGCATAAYYRKKSDSDIKAYIKNLYETRRAEVDNEYWVPWDSLGNYTGERGRAVGYWLYWNDFHTICESNDAEITRKTVSMDYSGGTYGVVEDETVRVRANWESVEFDNIIGDDFTCKTLKDRMANYASDYAAVSIDYLGSQCRAQLNPVIENKLKEYQNAIASGSGDLQAARDYIAKWSNYQNLGNNDFIEQTEKGGYICNESAGAKVDFSVDSLTPQENIANTSKDKCGSGGGAKALGWIVCPILNWMGEAATGIYNDYVAPNLEIQPKLFSGNDSDGTREGWGVFQRIANIIFVILMLVVIFSQITGVGIDNYGIKRILPKMILVAILANLSYIICVACVDVSNIAGNGIQALFNNLPPTGYYGVDVGGSATGSTIASVAILGGIFAGSIAMVWASPAILLSLLVSAIGIMIAIFFLFILLVAREAVVVVLVVISPLAFVCYLLPNTKKYFDKFIKLAEGLLLVYPICGLLVGGGDYVSRLLLKTGMASQGTFGALVPMVVSIIPIFFLPMVLKNSFSAMGSIGTKFASLGNRLGAGATKRINSSDAYKRAQTRVNSGIDRNGNLTGFGRIRANINNTRFGRLAGFDRRQAAYIAQAKKGLKESEAAGAMLTGALARTGIVEAAALPDSGRNDELGQTFAAGTEGAYYGGQFLEAVQSRDITNMNAAIEAMRASNMKPKDIAKLVRYAQNHGYFNGMDTNTKSAWLRDLAKKYSNDFLATDFELNHFASTGGTMNNGALGTYGAYAASGAFNMDDVKPEDVSKLSGENMAGMAMAGMIDQSMAQRVLANSPNLSADKKIMLGAIANGARVTDVGQFVRDAKALTTANFSGGMMSIGGIGVDKNMRDAWTASTPQEVNVVQNFMGGGRQYDPVEVLENNTQTQQPQPQPNAPTNNGGGNNNGRRGGPSNRGGGRWRRGAP